VASERERLGDFEIVREIGRGGMGVVYEAIQLSLNRKVALKVLLPGATPEQRDVERFQREARGAALLDHPRIVPIYAQGEEGGTYYYAMKLVQGRSLNHVIRDTREKWEASYAAGRRTTLSQQYFRTAARLIMEAAEALEYAHSQGVIHRDIKPHNLILTPEGHPVITDFGLARFLSAPSVTISGEMMGTPAYMSPEQVRAEQQAIDHRTDIYSLGVTLYEMLALDIPFRAETREAMLRQILLKDPAPLGRLNPRIPRDLETICHKAIEKDPGRRYQSAKLFAHDLRCFLEGLPIVARPIGPLGRLYRHALRRKALTAAIAGALLALIAGTYFGLQAHRARQAQLQSQRQAEAERLRAETETAAKLEEQFWNLLGQGRAALASGSYPMAKRSFLDAARIKGGRPTELCFWELARSFSDSPLATLTGLQGAVNCVAFSPDGRSLAAATASGLKLCEVTTGSGLRELVSYPKGAVSLAFGASGTALALNCSNGQVEVRDVGAERQVVSLEGSRGVLSPDGQLVATLTGRNTVGVWDLATGQERWRSAPGTVDSLAFSFDSRLLAAGVGGGVKLWEAVSGKEVSRSRGSPIRRGRLLLVRATGCWRWARKSGR